MDETDPVLNTVVSGSEVGNDQIADIKPEIRDDFYYFQNLVFKVMSSFSLHRILNWRSRHVLKVEDTLFCVPRNAFERPNGNFFSDTLFSVPGPGENGEQMEGRDDKHPILLEGVVKEHFRGFLHVMYPLWVLTGFRLAKYIDYIYRSNGVESTTMYEDWVGVLHLATMWGFVEVCRCFQTCLGYSWNSCPCFSFRFERGPSKLYRPSSMTNPLSTRSFSPKGITSRNGFSKAILVWYHRTSSTSTNCCWRWIRSPLRDCFTSAK